MRRYRTMHDFLNYIANPLHTERLLVEQLIASENKNNETWHLIGYCKPCEKATLFFMDWQYSDGTTPNFRERLVCEHCGLNNRHRFMAAYLKDLIKEGHRISAIYLYEQVTGFYRYMTENISGTEIIGSEYLGFDKRGGEIINDIRHEDALNLSFADRSIDIIISNDVFEHVPDIGRAFAEAHRVLKSDGKLLFTIPFHPKALKSTQRTIISNGEPEYLLPEQYHGNPISEKGSLVFYDLGWDILDFCMASGFKDAYLLTYYSLFYGHIGRGLQMMFVAEK